MIRKLPIIRCLTVTAVLALALPAAGQAPGGGGGFLLNQRKPAAQEVSYGFFLARLGFQADPECDVNRFSH